MIYTPFVLFLIISAVINGGLAIYARHYQDVPSVRPFRILMWNAAAWAMLYGLGISTIIFPLKLFIVNITYIPSALTPLISLVLALEYTGRAELLTRRRLILLLVMPAVFLILAFTSQWHHLWRYDYQLIWSGPVPVLVATKGPLYWIYTAYMLALSFAVFIILVTSYRRRALYFRNTLILTIGMLIPVIVGTLYVFGLTPVRGFDWIPTSFIWMGGLFIWAVLRGRLFDVIPIARNTLMENIDELMIALNARGLVVDFNRSVRDVFASSPPKIGSPPTTFPQPWAEIFQRYADVTAGRNEVHVNGRIYEMDITPIHNGHAELLGRLFIFHDITRRKQVEENEREQRILAEALRETAEVLNSTLNYDDVLKKILENVGRVVPIDSANIALLDDEGVLHYILFYGYQDHDISREELETISFSLQSSALFKRVYDTGEPLIVPDTYANPDWIVTSSGAWIRSYAVIPLRVRDVVIGFLNLDSAVVGFYTPRHMYNLRAFADQAAVAVENARLYAISEREIAERRQVEEKLRQQNEYLSTLHQITVELLDRPSPESLLSNIAERAAALVNAQHGFIFLPENDFLVLRAATKGFARNIGRGEPKPGTGVLGEVWRSGDVFVVENYTAWELHDPSYDSEKLIAIAGIPIKAGENMAGVLEVANTDHTRPFSGAEIEILKRFALLASLVLDNTQLFSVLQIELTERMQAEAQLREANSQLETQMKQIQGLQLILREQVIRDPLTGLYNRRYLDESLERELAQAEQDSYPLSFVMIDIDRFKDVNDTFGHAAGDRVLQSLAKLLLSHSRNGDIIFRYGGEELLAVLPNSDVNNAFQIAERWRAFFERSDIRMEKQDLKATISCGVSSFPMDGRTKEELIYMADKAMYAAKRLGRNQVAAWAVVGKDESDMMDWQAM